MASIVIMDSEPAICSSLKFALAPLYHVETFNEGKGLLQYLENNPVHAVLLSKNTDDSEVFNIMDEIKKLGNRVPVLVLLPVSSYDEESKCLQKGAFRCIRKPIDIESMREILSRAVEFAQLKNRVDVLDKTIKSGYDYSGLIGKSKEFKKIIDLIEKVKDADSNVMITGESGTGKDLVARAIHFRGNRTKEKFVAINCSAIPANLLESELFGYEKGAFTGAMSSKQGYFKAADRGTIFLDEIGDMDVTLQSKILRVLEEKKVYPVGSETGMPIDVRIITATNIDVEKAIKKKEFRLDLYYRLNVIQINMPPLRRRKEDIPLLVEHFIEKYSNEQGKKIEGITKSAMELLLSNDYEGNVRELENTIERAVLLCESSKIDAEDVVLKEPLRVDAVTSRDSDDYICAKIGTPLKEIERMAILKTLRYTGGNQTKAAGILGVTTRTLRNKLALYKEETPINSSINKDRD